LHEKITF